MYELRECLYCRREYGARAQNQRYCSSECGTNAAQDRFYHSNYDDEHTGLVVVPNAPMGWKHTSTGRLAFADVQGPTATQIWDEALQRWRRPTMEELIKIRLSQ